MSWNLAHYPDSFISVPQANKQCKPYRTQVYEMCTDRYDAQFVEISYPQDLILFSGILKTGSPISQRLSSLALGQSVKNINIKT